MSRLPLIRRAVWVRRRAGVPLVRLDAPAEQAQRLAAAVRGLEAPTASASTSASTSATRRSQTRRAA